LFTASVYGENKPITFDSVAVTYLDDKTSHDEHRCVVDVQATFEGWGSPCTLQVRVPMCGTIAWGCEDLPMTVEVVRGDSPEYFLLLSDAGVNDNFATIAIDANPDLDLRRCYIGDGFENEIVCRLLTLEVPGRYQEYVRHLLQAVENKTAA